MTDCESYAWTARSRAAEDWAWQLSARCRGEDSSVFFHPEGERGRARTRRLKRAKQFCTECPVAVQCRDHSLSFAEQFGIWGGLSEEERAALRGVPTRVRTRAAFTTRPDPRAR
jgi:WhiB family redox-sensing transcriptional regulator